MSTALERSAAFDEIYIIGEDIDLLVLLVGLCSESTTNVFFRKPGRGQKPQHIYSTSSWKHSSQTRKWVLFLHAFSGCDTTSSMFGYGKGKLITTIEKHPELQKFVSFFYNKRNDTQTVTFAGERIMISLYGCDGKDDSLNALRYKCFIRSTAKLKSNLSTLPPTTDAAKQHSLRTYHQVQMWLGQYLDADEWGWEKQARGWMPCMTTRDPAPAELLKLISCQCAGPCRAACGCRKAGLKCTAICKHCAGETCENVQVLPTISYDDNVSDDEDLYDYNKQTSAQEPLADEEDILNLTDDDHAQAISEPGPSSKRGRFE